MRIIINLIGLAILMLFSSIWREYIDKPGKSIKEGLHDWFEESADDL